MSHKIPRFRHRLILAACLSFAAGGCNVPQRVIDTTGDTIARTTGVSSGIAFRTVGAEGGPLDEEPMSGSELTIAEAVRRAVTTDSELQAAMARIRIAAADADQSRLLKNPMLDIVLRFSSGRPQVEASLAQDVVSALQIPKKARAADNRLRAAGAEAISVALDVTSQVQERYVAAQAAAAYTPLVRERLELTDQLLALAKSRVDAGEATATELTALAAQHVELQVEIDLAQLAEREERLKLARRIGEPNSAAMWTLDGWLKPEADNRSEDSWITAGLGNRPEIQAIAWKIKALGDDADLAGLLTWEGASIGLDAMREEDWRSGPSITTPLPVFDTGQARRARITAEQQEARHELTLAKRKTVEEIRIAFQSLAISTAGLHRIQSELVPLQHQRRQLAEDSFKSGIAERSMVLLAEMDLRNTQIQLVKMEQQVANARISLHRAVGGPGIAATVKPLVETPHAHGTP